MPAERVIPLAVPPQGSGIGSEVTDADAFTTTRSNDCSPVYRWSPMGRPFTVALSVGTQSHVGAFVPMGTSWRTAKSVDRPPDPEPLTRTVAVVPFTRS